MKQRLVIPPPPGLEPELARIIEALARKAVHDEQWGNLSDPDQNGQDAKTRSPIRPVFKRSSS